MSRPKIKAEVVSDEPWTTILAKAKISETKRNIIQRLMPHLLTPTTEWANMLQNTATGIDLTLDTKTLLKSFFSRNPFGCRNKMMIELICILHKYKPEEIAPLRLADLEATGNDDGTEEDKINLGIFDFASAGCVFKVLDTRSKLDNESKIAFFYRTNNPLAYYFGSYNELQKADLLALMRRHAPTLANFRPATEQEIIKELTPLSQEQLTTYIRKRFADEMTLLREFVDVDPEEYDKEEEEPILDEEEDDE